MTKPLPVHRLDKALPRRRRFVIHVPKWITGAALSALCMWTLLAAEPFLSRIV